MNKTLFGKFLLMSLIVIVVVSGLTAVIMNFFIKQYIMQTKQQEMLRQGERVVSNMIFQMQRNEGMLGMMGMMKNRGMWVTRSRQIAEEIEKLINGRIWLIDKDGQVFATAEMPLRKLTPPELNELLRGKSIVKHNLVDEKNNPVLAVAIPIQVEREVIGGLFVVTPMREVQLVQAQIRKIVMNSAFIGSIVAVFLAYVFSRHLTRPLLAMQALIGRMRSGDFSGALEIKREDELGELARHFNDLNRELCQTIELLSAERDQTQRIINSMAEGMISLSQQGDVLVVNPAARRILQATNMDASELRAVLHNVPELDELAHQISQEKIPVTREIQHNGQIFHVTGSPISTGEQMAGVVIILRDVTNRWRLIEMQKELVQNVSHEFKTPLTSIKGFVELMLDNKIKDQQVTQNALKVIHHETQRLTRMVNELLNMARLEVLRLKKEPVNLRALFEDVVENLSLKLDEAEVKVDLAEGLDQTFSFDPDRIEQVFYNLIDNAIRFSPEGSVIEVSGEEKGDVWEVRVRDHGPGVPENEQEIIFDRFYKVGKARSTDDSGFGLGLAIVKSIVEEHGGKIWVTNHPEGGAIFTVQLPGRVG